MNFTKLDQLMSTMPLRGLPGCELVVTHHGEVVYDRCAGEGIDTDTLWWIYSASKISTCVAAMQLVEQGRLELDAPVSRYLPTFERLYVRTENGAAPCKEPMRVIHLFTMTGGFDYDMTQEDVAKVYNAGGDTVAVASAMAKKTLLFEPGSHYCYSLCHDVLGAVVSRISGMPLGEYLAKNLWHPLKMFNTGFTLSDVQKPHLAEMYRHDRMDGTAKKVDCPARPYDNPNYESGGGGVFSRAGDYIRLMTALSLGGVSKDGLRILKTETVKELEINRLNEACRRDLWGERLYGYGWGLCGRVHMNQEYSLSRSSVGEFGWDGAAAAYALADRKKEIAIFFATHVFGCNYAYNLVHGKLRDAAYEAIEGES